MIIIGWKAEDVFLLGLMKKHLTQGTPIIVVSSKSSNDVSKKLNDMGLNSLAVQQYFSTFITSGNAEVALSASNVRQVFNKLSFDNRPEQLAEG